MPAQGAAVNTDVNGKATTAYYANRGDGTSSWYQWRRTANGGDVTQGATTDAAVTDPTASGSVVALLKGLLTFLRVSALGLGKAEDTAHASGDVGVMALGVRRDTPAASSSASGEYEPMQTDQLGRLRATLARANTNATSSALEATRIVKADAGVLYGISGHAETDGYVLIGNKATALNGTADALFAWIKVAEGPWSIDYGVHGRTCSAGISVGFSTGLTFVSGGANMMCDAQYE